MSTRTASMQPTSTPWAPAPGRTPPEWLDRFLGSDPGLTRLLTASQAVATIGVAMLAEWLFVRWTHALQIATHGAAPAQAAAIAEQHHGVLLVAILVGSIMGMLASFCAAMFPTPREQLTTFALMPVPMLAGLALGLVLAPHRAFALASFVVVLGLGAYCQRFGPRGFVAGMVLFMGDFFGFFLHGEIHLADLGWLTAEVVIGVLVAILAQFTLFYPSRRAALRRMRHSYVVRTREVARAARDVFADNGDRQRASRRLHRRLVRLNEAALLIDAQLAHPGALPAGWSATALHQRYFDCELALTNMARFAEWLAGVPLSAEIRSQVSQALIAGGELDVLRAEFAAHELLARLREQRTNPEGLSAPEVHRVLHRFAISVLGFTEAFQASRAESSAPGSTSIPEEVDGQFAPSVTLVNGWLPGSAKVSAAASREPGPQAVAQRWPWNPGRAWERVQLAPYARLAIQMSVAVTAALVLGDVVSGRRFYWAVLAAFVTFIGANNTSEQLRKGFLRVGGTMVGVLLGAVGAHLVGNRTGIAIGVILSSLFIGLYLMRISYGFMVICVTIMVSQLYVQLDEFSNAQLVLRLEETALGAGVTALVVLCVFPLRTSRVAGVAARHYIQALADVAEQAVRRLTDHGGDLELRAAIRRLDGAYQTLISTTRPMRIPFTETADGQRERFLHHAAAARHYARNLLTDTTPHVALTPQTRDELDHAQHQLTHSIGEMVAYLQDSDRRPRTYVRAAASFDLVATRLEDSNYLTPPQLALRDLQLLDGAAAAIAQTLGLSVQALDTTGTPSPAGLG